jgi:TM2 domain-containing membrane protein YozV
MTTESETQKPVTAYCRICGKALTEETLRMANGTVYCEEHLPSPATQQGPPAASPYATGSLPNPGASPGLAFVLGLIPGVGAIYNGQYAKGLVHVLVLGLLISIMNSDAAGGLEPLFGMIFGVFYFYMAFEAYHTARKRQLGEPVDEFSSLIQMGGQQSRAPWLPIVLIGLGIVFLLNNLELLHLRVVLKYWPVLLIVAGTWMLVERFRSRNGGAGDETTVGMPPAGGGPAGGAQ